MQIDHSTIHRWVIRYAPQLEENCRQHHKKTTGLSCRMDETYIKIKGQWDYLYRAVYKEGKIIDFMLPKNRDQHHMLKKKQHQQSSILTIFEQFYQLTA